MLGMGGGPEGRLKLIMAISSTQTTATAFMSGRKPNNLQLAQTAMTLVGKNSGKGVEPRMRGNLEKAQMAMMNRAVGWNKRTDRSVKPYETNTYDDNNK